MLKELQKYKWKRKNHLKSNKTNTTLALKANKALWRFNRMKRKNRKQTDPATTGGCIGTTAKKKQQYYWKNKTA